MKICFVTYEIHPTTRGGCGVLLHHAAELLLREGHEVIFLLDIPLHEFRSFIETDRKTFANWENCRAYHVGTLCSDAGIADSPQGHRSVWESVRFAAAWEAVERTERPDAVEFFEYCGVTYHALVRRAFSQPSGSEAKRPTIAIRLHNSLELMDRFGAVPYVDLDRYRQYALERASLRLAEAVLTPTRTYFDKLCRPLYPIDIEKVVVSQSPKLPSPAKRRIAPDGSPRTILFVGRMFAFKGVDQFVRAAVELLRRRPNLKETFELIGPDSPEGPLGSFTEYLRSFMPETLRARFHFTGNLTHERILERLASASFAVFPNKLESFCYALHEVYDAGVPVIINDIAGLADFFRHESNCLTYDGRTDSLVAAMERLIDDTSLRDRLSFPYPVAQEPLGKFYQDPRPRTPVLRHSEALQDSCKRTLVVVLAVGGTVALQRTLDSLRSGELKPAATVCLHPVEPSAHEAFWFLGRPWRLCDADGKPLPGGEVRTLDAVVVLRAGDVPDASWLNACWNALANRPDFSFAGTWGTRDGRIIPNLLDLTPEAWPFERGPASTRALIRTSPGLWLADLLDHGLGDLGEIGLVWDAIARLGPGAMLDRPLLELASETPQPPDPSLLKYLLARYGDACAERLRLYAALQHDRVLALQSQLRASAGTSGAALVENNTAEPSLDHKIRIADELGGSLLAKMAWKKLSRRLRGQAPPRR